MVTRRLLWRAAGLGAVAGTATGAVLQLLGVAPLLQLPAALAAGCTIGRYLVLR